MAEQSKDIEKIIDLTIRKYDDKKKAAGSPNDLNDNILVLIDAIKKSNFIAERSDKLKEEQESKNKAENKKREDRDKQKQKEQEKLNFTFRILNAGLDKGFKGFIKEFGAASKDQLKNIFSKENMKMSGIGLLSSVGLLGNFNFEQFKKERELKKEKEKEIIEPNRAISLEKETKSDLEYVEKENKEGVKKVYVVNLDKNFSDLIEEQKIANEISAEAMEQDREQFNDLLDKKDEKKEESGGFFSNILSTLLGTSLSKMFTVEALTGIVSMIADVAIPIVLAGLATYGIFKLLENIPGFKNFEEDMNTKNERFKNNQKEYEKLKKEIENKYNNSNLSPFEKMKNIDEELKTRWDKKLKQLNTQYEKENVKIGKNRDIDALKKDIDDAKKENEEYIKSAELTDRSLYETKSIDETEFNELSKKHQAAKKEREDRIKKMEEELLKKQLSEKPTAPQQSSTTQQKEQKVAIIQPKESLLKTIPDKNNMSYALAGGYLVGGIG